MKKGTRYEARGARLGVSLIAVLFAGAVWAKIPPPPPPDEKAKAAAEEKKAKDAAAAEKAKADQAAATISDDPFYWYFSAALAIREGDHSRATASIGKALTLAPSDPAILLEAGYVADFNGDGDAARDYWRRAAASDPNGPAGKAAAKAVEMLGVTPTVKAEAPPPPKKNQPRS